MNQSVLNAIKIKGTPLDRRFKTSPEIRKHIKELYNSGLYTRKELAEMFNYSQHTIYRYTIDPADLSFMRAKDNESHKRRYAILSKDARCEKSRKSAQSTRSYKEQLLETKLENLV